MTGPSADPAEAPLATIAIVGLGLIGGSIALAARRRWPAVRIVAVDRADVVAEATARQVVDEASVDLTAVGGADLIVLAAPVGANPGLLSAIPHLVSGPALVTDTGGTKRSIMAAASGLPGRLTFIGGHPMAGGTGGGLGAARCDLFDGRPWLLTPAHGDEPAVGPLAAFVEGLGARAIVTEAATHDRVLAYVSHLPQMTASALMSVVGGRVGEEGLAWAGGGLADTTRLAASEAAIWRDVALANRDHLGEALDDLITALQALRRDLGSGSGIDRLFGSARAWRETLRRQGQSSPGEGTR
ncbi:MAG: prephenate dehydrogenase/arogenate dehydrogenase family protein [Acidobacteriota bacterium]|nr:prephenate dehydrogenase/arogenate dehydrogenase family protein [Acidobacteriota bacterium]